LAHSNHDSLVAWASNNAREDGTWCVIPSKSRLHHSRSIVTDEGRNLSLLMSCVLLQDEPRSLPVPKVVKKLLSIIPQQ
jgi:hypothetical protein